LVLTKQALNNLELTHSNTYPVMASATHNVRHSSID